MCGGRPPKNEGIRGTVGFSVSVAGGTSSFICGVSAVSAVGDEHGIAVGAEPVAFF